MGCQNKSSLPGGYWKNLIHFSIMNDNSKTVVALLTIYQLKVAQIIALVRVWANRPLAIFSMSH